MELLRALPELGAQGREPLGVREHVRPSRATRVRQGVRPLDPGDLWLRFYAEGDFEEIVPTLKDAPMEDLVVDLLASGMGTHAAELRELLMSSFTGATYWRQKLGEDRLVAQLDKAIDPCVQGGMAARSGDELIVTRLGSACASKGIGVATAAAHARWATEAKLLAFTDLEVLTVAAMTKAGQDVHITLHTDEFNRVDY